MSSIVRTDIAILAAEAAIDINNMVLGRSNDFMAMQRLASFLNNLIGDGGDKHDASRPSINTTTICILNAAVTKMGSELRSVEELLGKVGEIARTLSSDKLPENRKELEQIETFCFALSKAIMEERGYHLQW